MTTEVQQNQQRSVFKMNADFWNQARGPPQNLAQNLTSGSNQSSPVPGNSAGGSGPPAPSPSQQSSGSQNQIVTAGALSLQQQQQQQQQAAQQQAAQQQAQQQQAQQQQAVQQAQQAAQQAQMAPQVQPGPHSPGGPNSPDKMTEKLVNELQIWNNHRLNQAKFDPSTAVAGSQHKSRNTWPVFYSRCEPIP